MNQKERGGSCNKGKNKFKVEPNQITYHEDPYKEIIEEMNQLIRNLSNKVSNLKVKGLIKNPN